MIPQITNSVIVKWIKTEPYSIKEYPDKLQMSGYDSQNVYVEEIYDINYNLHRRSYYIKSDTITILLQTDYFYYTTQNKLSHIVTITDDGEFIITDPNGNSIIDMQTVCREIEKRQKEME